MAGAVQFAVAHLALSQGEAVRMASLYPAEYLGIASHRGRLLPGYSADMVLLDAEGNAVATWIDGKLVFQQIEKTHN